METTVDSFPAASDGCAAVEDPVDDGKLEACDKRSEEEFSTALTAEGAERPVVKDELFADQDSVEEEGVSELSIMSFGKETGVAITAGRLLTAISG